MIWSDVCLETIPQVYIFTGSPTATDARRLRHKSIEFSGISDKKYVQNQTMDDHSDLSTASLSDLPTAQAVALLSSGRLAGSKSQGVGRWEPAATRFIAFATNFPFFPVYDMSWCWIPQVSSAESNGSKEAANCPPQVLWMQNNNWKDFFLQEAENEASCKIAKHALLKSS